MNRISIQNQGTKRWRFCLSVFTLIYVFCSYFWLGRQTTVFADEPLKAVRQVWFFFGLDQDWRLFGPEVRSFNCFPSAIVTIDGAKLLWEAPHSPGDLEGNFCRLNLHRKFSIDNLPWMIYSGYWQRFAGQLAREFASKDDAIESVSLVLNYEYMDNPEIGLRSRTQLPLYSQKTFYFDRYAGGENLP